MKKKVRLTCLACCALLLLISCTANLAKKPQEAVQDPPPETAAADTDPSSESQDTGAKKKPKPKPEPTPEPAAPDTELSFDGLSMAFGFSDLTGNRLIIVDYIQDYEDEYDGPNYEDPAQYTVAVGPYGELVRISYSGWQDETAENDYRDAAYNFDNLSGYVYNTVGGRLQPDNTYILTTEEPLTGALIKLSPSSPPAIMDSDTEDYIHSIKGRGVKRGEMLAETEGGGRIGMVLFERLGDDMLFSIVYMDGEKVLFWDCQGEYDEFSTWRVDMGDEPGGFTPLCLARLDDGLLLLLTWRAPEGELIVSLGESRGRLVETADYHYGRYLSPP